MKLTWLFALLIIVTSCKSDDDGAPVVNEPTTAGMSYALSDQDFTTTYNTLRSALQSNPNISIIAEVNHKSNAQSIGDDLRNTRIIFFGNPALGTSLMQVNQLAGLDLPQKMLVYQDAQNNVFIGYNSTAYLSSRYNVGAAPTLQQISTALSNFAGSATNGIVSENSSSGITFRQGTVTIVSQNDFSTTYSNLRNAIVDNGDLTLVRELDHQLNAQSVGEELDPTRVIIFGNPNLGTPLMKASQTTALDLPQKMLVWQEDDGTVNISYNDPEYLELRHNIQGQSQVVATISSALAGLAVDAAN